MQVASNRKSKVDMLPDEIKVPLNALIRSGRMQQKDILAEVHKMIDEAGLGDEAKPSRTAFNRHVKRMEDTLRRLRMGREVAEVWVSKLGEAPVSDVGKLLMEFVQTMAVETSMNMLERSEGEEGEVISPKALGQLALVVQRIETAAMTSMKREKEIRDALLEEQRQKLEKLESKAGVTKETLSTIREALGIV
ncbi:DUF3486 family protein [Vibrio cholerae]|nr:DUF3486 family protein [Vibrio cholerae]